MIPIEFKEQTGVLAKDQPEYLPLPVWQDGETTISCWKFSIWERVKILFGCPLWLWQKNFGRPLQPQLPVVENPFIIPKEIDKNASNIGT